MYFPHSASPGAIRTNAIVSAIAALAMLTVAAAPIHSDDRQLLRGNHPVEAETLQTSGNADPNRVLTLEIRFALRNRAQLDTLLREQQDPASSNYHQWLATGEFDRRFGADPAQADAVSQWLVDAGLTVLSASPGSIQFTGNVAQTQRLLSVNIARFGSGKTYANVNDPLIPARFAGVIESIRGLDNMIQAAPTLVRRTRRLTSANSRSRNPVALVARSNQSGNSGAKHSTTAAQPDVINGGAEAFGPQDLWSFYDVTPLLNQNLNGAGQCIAIVGVSDFLDGAVSNFTTTFNLPAAGVTRKTIGAYPGINADETEALLDIEWSHAGALGAGILFYMSNDLTSAISAAINDNLCGAIGISFTFCSSSSSFFRNTLDPMFAKAASQGQSVFVATGDDGSAGVVFDSNSNSCVTANKRTVNEMAADPNVTAIGGTGFSPNFDGGGNNSGSVAESVYNDGIQGGGASGGGASAIFSKPTYQSGPGVPSDGKRDVPDISLIASPAHPGVFLGDDNGGSPVIDCCWGGTSLSAQVWAGFSQVIAQAAGNRLGNINSNLYALASNGLAGNGFRDVTSGNNNFNGVSGFPAGSGYDQSTGWGTVDMNTFADAMTGPIPTPRTGPLTVTPGSFKYATRKLGTISGAKHVKFKNPKRNQIAAVISSVALQTGTDFQIDPATTTCVNESSVLAGKKCKVALRFAPTSAGLKSDTLIVTDNSANSPHRVPLTATGK